MGETKTDKIFAKSPHNMRQHLVGIPSAVSSGLWVGESDYVPRADHIHIGLEHIKAEGYAPIYGVANLQSGSGMAITQEASGLWLHYTGEGIAPTDEKVKVSYDDTTTGYLIGKIASGSGISLTEVGGGGDEDLRFDVDIVGLEIEKTLMVDYESPTAIDVSTPVEFGQIFYYDSGNYSGSWTIYFEAYARNAVAFGTVYIDLYDLTTSEVITTLTITSTSFARSRSSSISLTDEHEYVARIYVDESLIGRGEIRGAKIVMIRT